MEISQVRKQTDTVILETLKYAGRRSGTLVNILLWIAGICLLLSPLYYVGDATIYWMLGLLLVVLAGLCTFLRRRSASLAMSNRAIYLVSLILQAAALVFEILPLGAVLVFAAPDPASTVRQIYSYFSVIPFGYANFTPSLTGLLTVTVFLLGIIGLCRFYKATKCRNAAFICGIIAAIFSLLPLVFYGSQYMTVASYVITALLLLSLCLQAVANRKT